MEDIKTQEITKADIYLFQWLKKIFDLPMMLTKARNSQKKYLYAHQL